MKLLRILIPIALVVLVLAQIASALHWFGPGDGAVPVPAGTMSSPVPIGGPFHLTAPDGRTVTDRDFRGRWMLVYFGYTNCPDTCPTALNDIGNALDMLGAKAKDIAPLFITIDPARDTPAVMGTYTAKFDSRILGLTGTADEIAQAKTAYRVYASPTPHEDHGRMVMDHSSVFIVMNPDGKFVDVINGNANPDAIAAKLRALDR